LGSGFLFLLKTLLVKLFCPEELAVLSGFSFFVSIHRLSAYPQQLPRHQSMSSGCVIP
jgi:hypothetical protein